MLDYGEIKIRKYIIFSAGGGSASGGEEPYEVMSSHIFRKQQRKPVNQTKLKNLITGRVVEHSFHQSDKVKEAEIETKKIKFLYSAGGGSASGGKSKEYWFSEENDPSKRFFLPESIVGNTAKFLKENEVVSVNLFNEEIFSIKLPVKMEFKVTEAPPNIKGNTAQGGNKPVTIETGAQVNTPLFIEEGDSIIVNTDSGEYVERVTK